MPRVTYKPGDTPQVIEWDWDGLDSAVASRIERMTGLKYLTEVPGEFHGGSIVALHAVLFNLCKIRGIIPANTTPEQFVFTPAEITDIETTDAEDRAFYEVMSKRGDLTDEQAEAVAEVKERLGITDADPDQPELDMDDGGKAEA